MQHNETYINMQLEETIKTNIFGIKHFECLWDNKVKKVIIISTDKALIQQV